MRYNSLLTPLNWYTSIYKQERYRLSRSASVHNYLLASSARLIPFVILTRLQAFPIVQTWKLVNLTTGAQINMASDLGSFQTMVGKIIFPGDDTIQTSIPDGMYYMHITSNQAEYFSDLICVKSDTSTLTKITWGNSCDMDGIPFSGGFTCQALIGTEQLAPKIELEEEGEKDGYGQFVPTLQKWTFKHTLVATDCNHALGIALTSLPLFGTVLIENGEDVYSNPANLKLEPEFDDDSAIIKLDFTEQTIIQKACC